MKIGIKYVGPMTSYSGYGEANRNYICALNQVGVDLTVEIVFYDNNTTNFFGESYNLAKKLEGRNINYDIKIIHIPCDAYLKHMEPCKYHIGHLFWETDKMSPAWVWNCNLMDEIWTGSDYNKEALEKSGVTRPIWVFPQAIDVELFSGEYEKWEIPQHQGFLFYSIFQWIERKNPRALVTAYLKEFGKDDKVGLLIKTYKEKFTKGEKQEIVAQVQQWRQSINKKDFPPIYVNVELMEKMDVARIHETGDCFVLPHHGEGWGIPLVESMLFGKPVIATRCGGVHDWLTKEIYFPLSYKKANVFGMEFAPWYKTDQKWAEIDIEELRSRMRWVYENQKKAKEVGMRGGEFVRQNFSFEAVGRRLKDRLIDIQKMIDEDKKKKIKWLRSED